MDNPCPLQHCTAETLGTQGQQTSMNTDYVQLTSISFFLYDKVRSSYTFTEDAPAELTSGNGDMNVIRPNPCRHLGVSGWLVAHFYACSLSPIFAYFLCLAVVTFVPLCMFYASKVSAVPLLPPDIPLSCDTKHGHIGLHFTCSQLSHTDNTSQTHNATGLYTNSIPILNIYSIRCQELVYETVTHTIQHGLLKS